MLKTTKDTRISVSIVTYNHKVEEIRHIIDCIDGCSYDVNIYISDNSIGENLKILENYKNRVTYIKNNKNIGFGSAHNRVFRKIVEEKVNIKYHFVVNPDVDFGSREVDELVNYMRKNPHVGACSPRAVYSNGELQVTARLIPNIFDLLLRRISFFSKLFRGRKTRNESPSFSKRPIECYFLHGFFLLLDFNVLKNTDGFDERFFMYMEDLDLIRRISKLKEVHYLPNVTIKHGYNRESGRSIKLLLIHLMSVIKYFNKWGWVFDQNRKLLNSKVLKQLFDF